MTKPNTAAPTPVQHGGNLHTAIQRYGIPRADWLDLSTGISPFPWSVPTLPADVWQRLPEADGALELAARNYYGCDTLPVPGSQWAIQQLPALFAERQSIARVWLPQECYEEYRYWWQFHGHAVQTYTALPAAEELQTQDLVIVLNPNNPSARYTPVQDLLILANDLRTHDGWLLVDEAFMDTTPEQSLLPHIAEDAHVMVLRSLGKFFGLAGIRTGFVCGNREIREILQQRLGPWSISHPTQWIATQALQDLTWQSNMRQQLPTQSETLLQCLACHFPAEILANTPLFVTLSLTHESALHWQDQLAHHGIWTRCFPHWGKLRVGLTDDAGMERLVLALKNCDSIRLKF
ncbi:MAG TPA: threonine-phosphate decarboxylase CobD [Dongiaceae bacterium]|nr:threonine-phosphate decarboxylase CobD [Dongiaceae bacterium]